MVHRWRKQQKLASSVFTFPSPPLHSLSGKKKDVEQQEPNPVFHDLRRRGRVRQIKYPETSKVISLKNISKVVGDQLIYKLSDQVMTPPGRW